MKRISAALSLLLWTAGTAPAQERQMLHAGWLIQSSAKVGIDGAAISAVAYQPTGWYRATVPSTVVGTLVDDSLYRDPFFGMNFRELPGTTIPIGANFTHTAMDPQSPYAVPWWYRTTFRVPATMRGRRVTLRFDGINYRANIWLNGRRLADSSAVFGDPESSDELEDVGWHPIGRRPLAPFRDVTQFMLTQAIAVREGRAAHQAPLLCTVGKIRRIRVCREAIRDV